MAATKYKGCINLLLASYFFDASINKVNPKNRRFVRVTAVYVYWAGAKNWVTTGR